MTERRATLKTLTSLSSDDGTLSVNISSAQVALEWDTAASSVSLVYDRSQLETKLESRRAGQAVTAPQRRDVRFAKPLPYGLCPSMHWDTVTEYIDVLGSSGWHA
jgi:hypothetical protein